MVLGLLMAVMSCLTANATIRLSVRIACPNDEGASPVKVYLYDSEGTVVAGGWTDELGIVTWGGIIVGETYTVCVVESTLPAGATLRKLCRDVTVLSAAPPVVEFTLGGNYCSDEPPPGEFCWLTGGGTIGKTKGVANFSYGGVVYPGCSPSAADGGNWNVVDHFTGLHFQGQQIIVDSCSGVETKSPRVKVNIIDFHGTGILSGIGGNPDATIPVSFVGRAIDNLESGSGSDQLFLRVSDGSATVLQVGTSADEPAVISTGNLQIHTTSCNK